MPRRNEAFTTNSSIFHLGGDVALKPRLVCCDTWLRRLSTLGFLEVWIRGGGGRGRRGGDILRRIGFVVWFDACDAAFPALPC